MFLSCLWLSHRKREAYKEDGASWPAFCVSNLYDVQTNLSTTTIVESTFIRRNNLRTRAGNDRVDSLCTLPTKSLPGKSSHSRTEGAGVGVVAGAGADTGRISVPVSSAIGETSMSIITSRSMPLIALSVQLWKMYMDSTLFKSQVNGRR